ncbi:MAG TPA: DUF2231 domain-containing protein [Povalibacter sp.]|nr:DUF2231 domain-containing protein [Povalibacter sp.]
MTRPLRLAGHPLHPLLVHFPIALWTVGVAADAAGWISHATLWWLISFGSQALGSALGIVAILAGFLEYATLKRVHAAQDTAVQHMMIMCSAWLLFLISLALRGLPEGQTPSPWATVVAAGGFVAMIWGGWLGGQLVYRFGVGTKAHCASE